MTIFFEQKNIIDLIDIIKYQSNKSEKDIGVFHVYTYKFKKEQNTVYRYNQLLYVGALNKFYMTSF